MDVIDLVSDSSSSDSEVEFVKVSVPAKVARERATASGGRHEQERSDSCLLDISRNARSSLKVKREFWIGSPSEVAVKKESPLPHFRCSSPESSSRKKYPQRTPSDGDRKQSSRLFPTSSFARSDSCSSDDCDDILPPPSGLANRKRKVPSPSQRNAPKSSPSLHHLPWAKHHSRNHHNREARKNVEIIDLTQQPLPPVSPPQPSRASTTTRTTTLTEFYTKRSPEPRKSSPPRIPFDSEQARKRIPDRPKKSLPRAIDEEESSMVVDTTTTTTIASSNTSRFANNTKGKTHSSTSRMNAELQLEKESANKSYPSSKNDVQMREDDQSESSSTDTFMATSEMELDQSFSSEKSRQHELHRHTPPLIQQKDGETEADDCVGPLLVIDPAMETAILKENRKRAQSFFAKHPDRDGLTGLESVQPREDVESERALESLPNSYMTIVKQLSKTVLDENGLPRQTIVVHDQHDDTTLFFFEVSIAPSGIPNSGNGAFIELKEVRKLSWEARHRKMLACPRIRKEVETMRPLPIPLMPHGTGYLKITGENIHGNNNSPYVPLTEVSLTAKFPDEKSTVTVRLKGTCIEPTPGTCTSDRPGIGILGLFNEADYLPATERFDPKRYGFIELDRYGPLRISDRKLDEIFQLKAFVLQSRPNEWVFGFDDESVGENCMVDITDDLTGDPHRMARERVPMYVNEVAHSRTLPQNVFVRDHSPKITYLCYLNSSMRIGSKCELLTHYMEHYEGNRVKKGYGLANIYEGVRGDDDLPSRLRRNFEERKCLAEVIANHVDVLELFRTFDDLEENIWIPLEKARDENDKSDAQQRRIVTLIRLQYVFRIISRCFEELRISYKKESVKDAKIWNFGRHVDALVDASQARLAIATSKTLISDTMRNILLSGDQLWNTVQYELIQEMTNYTQSRVLCPMDPSVWCPAAIELTRRLSIRLWDSRKKRKGSIFDIILEEASIARDAVLSNRKKLVFQSGIPEGYEVATRYMDGLNSLHFTPSLFTGHTGACMGYIYLLISECDALLMENSSFENISVTHKSQFVMSKRGCHQGISELLQQLSSAPALETTGEPSSANLTWYLTWQVGYVVDAFARVFCEDYSENYVRELSEIIGINYMHLQYACRTRMRPDRSQKFRRRLEPVATKKHENRKYAPVTKKKVSVGVKTTTETFTGSRPRAEEIWQGTPEDAGIDWPQGWKKKTFRRQSGASKGSTDSYWYTPVNNFKLRSLAEVRRFLTCLEGSQDEMEAWSLFRRGR